MNGWWFLLIIPVVLAWVAYANHLGNTTHLQPWECVKMDACFERDIRDII